MKNKQVAPLTILYIVQTQRQQDKSFGNKQVSHPSFCSLQAQSKEQDFLTLPLLQRMVNWAWGVGFVVCFFLFDDRTMLLLLALSSELLTIQEEIITSTFML